MKDNFVYELQKKLLQLGPLIGSRWRHYKGDTYKVILKAIESNEPHSVKVIYQSETFGYMWEHSLEEWEKTVDCGDGTVVKRFSPI